MEYALDDVEGMGYEGIKHLRFVVNEHSVTVYDSLTVAGDSACVGWVRGGGMGETKETCQINLYKHV